MLSNVSREKLDKLNVYCELLLKWNKKINLIARGDEDKIWERHIRDSFQVLDRIENSDKRIIDLGTGAGFPGIVLAICGLNNIKLIDSDERKCIFLTQVIKELGLNISVTNDFVSAKSFFECDVLVSRSFASIDDILRISRGMCIYDKIVLLKGKKYQTEIDFSLKNWSMDITIYDSITDICGKVIEIDSKSICRRK